MPTTRRARAAQSEDTQSPLRALELQSKSRKKISKAPKKIGKKVSDDKVTKKKAAPKGRGKKAARSTQKQAEEDLPEEMEEDIIQSEDTQAVAEAGIQEAADAGAAEVEQSETEMTDAEREGTEEMDVEPSEHNTDEEDEMTVITEVARPEVEDAVQVTGVITIESEHSQEEVSDNEYKETEHPAVEYVPSESEDDAEPVTEVPATNKDADGILYNSASSRTGGVELSSPLANGYNDTADRENLKSFCDFLKLSCLTGCDRFTVSSTNSNDPTFARAFFLERKRAEALISLIDRQENALEGIDPSTLGTTEIISRQFDPCTFESRPGEEEEEDDEEETGVESSGERAANPSAFTPEHFTPEESTSSGESPRRSLRLVAASSPPEEVKEEDEEDGAGSGSWLRRSFSKVTNTFNPMSWWTPSTPHKRAPIPTFTAPRTEPAAGRKPLGVARDAQLNTPVPAARQTRAPRTEPRRQRAGARAGESLGLFQGERKRAQQLAEQKYQQREAALLVKEQQLADDQKAFEERRSEWELRAKRKRGETGEDANAAVATPAYTGGRSTYSLDDASPASSESLASSSPLARRSVNTISTPLGAGHFGRPVTPSRSAGRDGDATPLTSILKKGGAQTEPAFKRQRTGRSVVFKNQLEDESPLEKHEPAKRRFVPVTPYKVGSMWETPRTLRSAQKPGVSRTILGGSLSRIQPNRTRPDVTPKYSNSKSVPECDSSDDEDEMIPETPSKKSSGNIESAGSTPFAKKTSETISKEPSSHTESAGSTPFTAKTIEQQPPAAPQPAHASLPSVATPPASEISTPSTFTPMSTDSPQSPVMTEKQRLSKARERATQFTPKQPSRLRESESTAPAAIGGKHIPQTAFEKDGGSLARALMKPANFDKEVLDAIASIEVPVAAVESIRLPSFDETGIDKVVLEAVNNLWNDSSNGHAEQSLAYMEKVTESHMASLQKAQIASA